MISKQRSDDDFRQQLLISAGPDLLNWGNAIWHGIVGAELIKKELKIFDGLGCVDTCDWQYLYDN